MEATPAKVVEQKNDGTISGLRTLLFSTLDGVLDGTVDVRKANQVAQLSQRIINSIKVELEYRKLTRKETPIPMLEK